MTFLIGSDIHGSYFYAKKFFSIAGKLNPEKIILLGDFYYSGARNIPPEEYSPRDCVQLVNSFADKIIAIKGNCESEVDQRVSPFLFSEVGTRYVFGKQITRTHGHRYSFDSLPKDPGDIFLQGHTHIGVLEKKDNLILANPGSISLPKDGRHSYRIRSEEGRKLIDLLTGETVKEIRF